MKRSSMFILMIVVVAVHRTAQNSVCNTSNPFLEKLRRSSIDFLPSPNYQSQKCPFEWGVHGTCCIQDQMTSFANEDRLKVTRSVEEFISFVHSFKGWFKNLQENIQDIQKSGVAIVNPKVIAFFEAVKSPEVQTSIERLIDTNYAGDFISCWNQMITIRTNSICSLCSTRWHQFFFSTGEKKAWLSKGTCSLVISACKPSFQKLVEFIELVDKINGQIRNSYDQIQLKTIGADKLFYKIEEWVKEISKKFIKSFLNSNESQKMDQLCEVSLQVYGKTMIEKVASVFNKESISKLNELISHLREKIQKEKSGSRLRLLQSDLNSNFAINDQLFVGDVKVMANTDSSYTSYYGATGTSGNENSMHMDAIPLNITSKFV